MRRLASGSVCFSCRSTLLGLQPTTIPIRSAQPCLGQRYASVQKGPKARPSRMVLADNVGRSPARGGSRSRREGPFGGLNRTVANVDRGRPTAATAAKDSRGKKKLGAADDRKALKMQRVLAPVSYGRRTADKERMADFESFEQFDLLPTVKEALLGELFKKLVDVKPTPVQRLAIPALLGQHRFGPRPGEKKEEAERVKSFLLAAETGSGKTLAYLLPAINALKIAESRDADAKAWAQRRDAERELRESGKVKGRAFDEPHPTMARPKVVILVPTAELAMQVTRVAKTLSHVVKFKAEMISSDLKPQQIQRNIYGPMGIDLVVATPHLLASIADSDPNVLSRVSHLIVDEADSLLDRSFAPVTTSIVERAMPSLKQFICCSATIPRKMNNYLATNYPKMHRITTPNLHAIPRRVQLGVIDVSRDPYRNNKNLACAEAIYTIGREAAAHEGPVKDEVDVRRIIVFVNEREKTEEVAAYLRSEKIDAQALHRDTPEKRHGEILETFTSNEALTTAVAKTKAGRIQNVKVLVVTDLASRGIDTLAVRHVILYDVPHTTIDFIHRLGRAGRMGRRGRGIVLAGNDDRKDVIAEVKRSMFMGQALI
ncbi:ATP-dependent RNA helicase-like protein [Hapsidospora chrysogenum ATCC 11550]|uniref:RNA helicase n=1 Tax=Hapsidospora chrysogenum (strain ATCC 11550 / CBS 779.69 / DSM 880 / IAM 14645 / JCM 23072 / IMI 49137) TaxID=857340 RepID=A0A086TFC0_HAPC1|nr:ATP-dependent RNA helicase-like protein [Hapsidospora chrysogenum ATCC 11550]